MITWEGFMDAWGRGEWILSTCRACGHVWGIPRASCPRCGNSDARTEPLASTSGTVRAWTRVEHAFYSRSAGPPPFVIGIVDADEPHGLVLIGEIHPGDGGIRAGDRVQLSASRGADGSTRPGFIPA